MSAFSQICWNWMAVKLDSNVSFLGNNDPLTQGNPQSLSSAICTWDMSSFYIRVHLLSYSEPLKQFFLNNWTKTVSSLGCLCCNYKHTHIHNGLHTVHSELDVAHMAGLVLSVTVRSALPPSPPSSSLHITFPQTLLISAHWSLWPTTSWHQTLLVFHRRYDSVEPQSFPMTFL